MKQVSCRVTEAKKKKFMILCLENNTTVQAVLEKAIDNFIKKHKNKGGV